MQTMPNYGTIPTRRWSGTFIGVSQDTGDGERTLSPSVITKNVSRKKSKSKAGATSSPSSMVSTTASGGNTPAIGALAPMPTPASCNSEEVSPRNSGAAPKDADGTKVDAKHRNPPPRRSRRLLSSIPTPTLRLENSGSVARDHLALERTFLAYIRTSLALASTGVALVQLFTVSAKLGHPSPAAQRIQKYAPALGATLISLGIAVTIIGVMRFFAVQFALVKGHFPVARLFIAFIAAVLSVLIVIIFGILVAGRR